MARETVGKISSELLQKTPESRDPIELQRAMQSEYIHELKECITSHIKLFDDDFYIVVITKNEKLMPNVFRNYFSARLSCPTPDYDQAVFKYFKQTEHAQFLWVIPSKDACCHLRDNASHIVPEEQELLKYVLQFFDGSLLKLAKKMNNEEIDSILVEKL